MTEIQVIREDIDVYLKNVSSNPHCSEEFYVLEIPLNHEPDSIWTKCFEKAKPIKKFEGPRIIKGQVDGRVSRRYCNPTKGGA
jgi:hypothetical protein